MTASTFSWMAYDDAERDQFAALVRALDEPETLDSLGLGVVRDTIADLLFPGTSTIQTRARYFVLVARAAVAVERSGPKSTMEFDKRLRSVERRTLEALRVNGKRGIGIIGWDSGPSTKRWPSAIYWNGLSEWGIRRRATSSLRSYSVAVSAQARRRALRLADEPGEGDALSAWWDELPVWEGDEPFPGTQLEILPTPTEAGYLLDRMTSTFAGGQARPSSLRGQRSLLSYVAENLSLADASFPWEIHVPDPYLSDVLWHAEMFSRVLWGAQLRYNRLLVDRARNLGNDVDDADLAEMEVRWLEDMEARQIDVAAWADRYPAFVALLRGAGGRLTSNTRIFFERWINAAVQDAEKAYWDDALAEVVRNRELELKGRHARLVKSEALTRWSGTLFGVSQLNYRWGRAAVHLRDCRHVLGSGIARA